MRGIELADDVCIRVLGITPAHAGNRYMVEQYNELR